MPFHTISSTLYCLLPFLDVSLPFLDFFLRCLSLPLPFLDLPLPFRCLFSTFRYPFAFHLFSTAFSQPFRDLQLHFGLSVIFRCFSTPFSCYTTSLCPRAHMPSPKKRFNCLPLSGDPVIVERPCLKTISLPFQCLLLPFYCLRLTLLPFLNFHCLSLPL